MKKVKSEPQQVNLDDLEGLQPGTPETCAPGIALLAQEAHIRAPANCSGPRAQAHV